MLPINDELIAYAEQVQQKLQAGKIRVTIDKAGEKLGAKIRRAESDKVSYMLVLGAKEKEVGQVSVRSRVNKAQDGTFPVDVFVQNIVSEVANRSLPQRS